MIAQKPVIKQILAAVLLLVFTFSIAPKKFLHDAIATHQDKTVIVAPGENAQLSHTAFVCKCDSLVAESVFTNNGIQHFCFVAPIVFVPRTSSLLYHYPSSPVFFFELRGPPSGHSIS
ncbi:MAG: hypothetical protein QM726_06280 [Chitinophagaceae bacterium]